jgi:hypothetical protein
MLGHTYRFTVNNQCGQTLDSVTIKSRRWKFASDGSITFDSEVTVYSEASIANSATAWVSDTAIDNSSDKYVGADLEITIDPPASSCTGAVSIQIERSTDGGTDWPTAGNGEPVASYYFNAYSSGTAILLNGTL